MPVSLPPLPTNELTDVVATMVAHQGGWDEMLMVAVPIAVFALLLRAANRRAGRLAEDTERDGAGDEPPTRARSRRTPRNPRGGPI